MKFVFVLTQINWNKNFKESRIKDKRDYFCMLMRKYGNMLRALESGTALPLLFSSSLTAE